MKKYSTPELPCADSTTGRTLLTHEETSDVIQSIRALEALPKGAAVIDNVYCDVWLKTTSSNTLKGWKYDAGFMGEKLSDALYESYLTEDELRASKYQQTPPSEWLNAEKEIATSFDLVDEFVTETVGLIAIVMGEVKPLLEMYEDFKDD